MRRHNFLRGYEEEKKSNQGFWSALFFSNGQKDRMEMLTQERTIGRGGFPLLTNGRRSLADMGSSGLAPIFFIYGWVGAIVLSLGVLMRADSISG